jgi:O-acetyl-ADP-ribose deacetylase (regulator of RNase III)
MPLSLHRGDLFAAPALTAFAHGCNCAGAMGAGIAVAFKARWPAMYVDYKARCADGRFALGDVFVWREGGATVFNLATQPHWRAGAELDAITSSVAAMLREGQTLGLDHIAMPRIGAGLGGLDWAEVLGVIAPLAAASAIDLRVCDVFAAGEPLRPLL